MSKETKKTRGRPSKYTKRLAQRICDKLSEGMSLNKICQSKTMPTRRTVARWALDNDEFCRMYREARQNQADYFLDQIVDIADDGLNDTYVDEKGNTRVDSEIVRRSELRIRTRQWVMERMNPAKYGPKPDHDDEGDKEPQRVQLEIVDARVRP